MKPTIEQKQFVNCPRRLMCLCAGGGCGKTECLIRFVVKKVKEQYENILLLAYTNPAADTMQDKLTKLKAMNGSISISTFHSFAYQQLKINAVELALKKDFIVKPGLTARLLKQVIRNRSKELTGLDSPLKTLAKINQDHLHSGQSIHKIAETIKDEASIKVIKSILVGIKTTKLHQGTLDFDDLPYLFYKLLKKNPDTISDNYNPPQTTVTNAHIK